LDPLWFDLSSMFELLFFPFFFFFLFFDLFNVRLTSWEWKNLIKNSCLQLATGGKHPTAHAQSPRTTILGSRASLLTSLALVPLALSNIFHFLSIVTNLRRIAWWVGNQDSWNAYHCYKRDFWVLRVPYRLQAEISPTHPCVSAVNNNFKWFVILDSITFMIVWSLQKTQRWKNKEMNCYN
jgi:hypothetical protein